MNKTARLFAGKNIYYYQTVDSTNHVVRRLAEQGSPANSIVLADEQLGGRGRLGRNWFSPPGSGLWFSVLLRPENFAPSDAAPITLVTSAVIAAHLRKAVKLPVEVKWPNDLLLSGKKVCGILSELETDREQVKYIIVGIGLNVNQKQQDFPVDLVDKSTSLYLAGGNEIDRTRLFLVLREALISAYSIFFRKGFSPFRKLWLQHNTTLGKPVNINWPNGRLEGKAIDLAEDGSLIVEDKLKQTHVVNYGEIKS